MEIYHKIKAKFVKIMLTLKDIGVKGVVIESFFTFVLGCVFFKALFVVGSPILVSLFVALAFAFLFQVCKKNLLAFGNPIFTVVFTFMRKISLLSGLVVLIVQFGFSYLAALAVFQTTKDLSNRLNGLLSFSKWSLVSAASEAVGAFLLVLGVLSILNMHKNSETDKNDSLMFSVLITVYFSITIPIMLGSLGMLNPAWAVALRIHTRTVYTLAPFVGALAAMFWHLVVFEGKMISIKFKKIEEIKEN